MYTCMQRLRIILLGLVLGVSIIVFGLVTTYGAFSVTVCTFGFLTAGHHAQSLLIMAEIVPKDLLSEFIGINVFIFGFGVFAVSVTGGKASN